MPCFREKGNPNVGCSGHTMYADNLELLFIFKRTETGHWREMLAATLGLLKSFEEKQN